MKIARLALLLPLLSLLRLAGPVQAGAGDPSLLYVKDGLIYRFDLDSQQALALELPYQGAVVQAKLSANGKTLVFQDEAGIGVAFAPFDRLRWRLPIQFPPAEPDLVYFKPSPSEPVDLLPSPDGTWLAHADDYALKLTNTFSGKTIIVIKQSHVRYDFQKGEENIHTFRYYRPVQWSPDGRQMWIYVGHWEGFANIMLDLSQFPPSLIHYHCYFEISWSPDGKNYAAAVNYSGYLGCGYVDGIFTHARRDGRVARWRIVSGTGPIEPGLYDYHQLSWSPSGNWITFTQDLVGSDQEMVIVSTTGSETRVLFTTQDQISSSAWDQIDAALYLTEVAKDGTRVIRIERETAAFQVLSSVLYKVEIHSLAPGGRWLALDHKPDYRSFTGLSLLDGSSGTVLELVKDAPKSYKSYFAGWLP